MAGCLTLHCLLLVGFLYLVSPAQAKGGDKPRNVTAEALNATAIVVKWTEPRTAKKCAVSRYLLRYKHDDGGKSLARRVPGTQTGVTLAGLRSDTRYYIRLVAVGCRGKSPPTKWAKAKTAPHPLGDGQAVRSESTEPGKPSEVRTRTFPDSIIIEWLPPEDNVLVRGYMVGYGEGVPDVNWQYVDANTRTFKIINLKPATQYVISLRAFNNFGKGPVVYDLLYTREEHGESRPTVGPLAPPIGLKSKVLSPSTVWLEWIDPSLGRAQKITDDRYYIVNYREQPQGEVQALTVKALSVVLYEMLPDTTYEFRVQCKKGTESTAFSIPVYNKTFDTQPSTAPTWVSMVPGKKSSSVRITWAPPKQTNGQITGYVILYTTNSSVPDRDWYVIGSTGDRLSLGLDDLRQDETYFFKIQARNRKGYGPLSSVATYSIKNNSHSPAASAEEEESDEEEEEEENEPTPTTDSPPPTTTKEETPDEIDELLPGLVALEQKGHHQKEEKEMVDEEEEEEADYMMSVPVTLKVAVRHLVSAVITWTDAAASSCREDDKPTPAHYVVYYNEGNKAKTGQMSVKTSDLFVILDGLKPGVKYHYQVEKVSEEDGGTLWSHDGVVDTRVHHNV